MATFDYNPITGNLDLVGSGASYINGVVADPTALPVTVGTPPLDSVYLAKAGSGVWLINRKPAGLYCRVANNGNAADWAHLGAFPEVNADGNWELYNSADPTKELKFDLSAIATGNTRTISVPNKNVTLDDASDARTPTAHNHAASAITSGVFDNARINFAAPSAIGSTTPSTGAFTTLSASTSLTLGTSGILSGGTNTIEQRNTTSAQTFRIYNTVSGAADANFERGFMRWSSNVLQIGTEAGGTGSGSRSIAFQTGGVTRVTIAPEGTYLPTILFAGNAQIQAAFGSGIIRLVDNGGTGFDRLQLGGGTSSFPALKRSSTTLQVRLADDSAFAPLQCSTLVGSDNGTVATLGSSGEFRLTSTGQLGFASRGAILMSADGVMWLSNNAGTSFGRLIFGGTTSSFPALKRSSTALQVRLGDDSGFATIDGQLQMEGTAPATSGATGTAGDIRYDADYIYVCTAANTWKRAAIATW